MENGALLSAFLNHRPDKYLSYISVYEREMSRFRHGPITLLEIGVQSGRSLRMWQSYFSPGSRLIGLDINPNCEALCPEGCEIYIGDQADPVVYETMALSKGSLNVLIDDGSHKMKHQIDTLSITWPLVSEGGLYIVEDTHTSYYEIFNDEQNGFLKPHTFMEFSKGLIDLPSSIFWRGSREGQESVLARDFCDIESVSFYNSMVILKKGNPAWMRPFPGENP